MATLGKKILNKAEARAKILQGILEVSNTVSSTYGPQGRTVIFEKGNDARITKDGITVAKEIKFSDEAKNLGALLVKKASGTSNQFSGDGSTSTTILTAEFCKQAHYLLNQGIDINDLREGYQIAYEEVLASLEKYKKTIESEDDIYNIALISSNGDIEIAKNIQEAFLSIGDDGVVAIGDSMSRKGETSVKIATGLEFDKGYLSSLSVNSTNDQCILQNAKVLMSIDPINEIDFIAAIVQPLQLSKTSFIAIAPDYSEEVTAWFRELLSKKAISGALILAPGVSKQNIYDKLNDIAVILDAKLYGQDFDIDDYNQDCLGEAGQIVISKGKTSIIDAKTDEERFEEYISLLKAKIVTDSTETGYSEYEIESIKERIAKMTGGVATILIGALDTIELAEKKDRYEDAVNAVRSMLQDGYIPGAGTTLLRISYENKQELKIACQTAYNAYMKAIRKPAQLLIESGGADVENIIPEILTNENLGYNARLRKIDNLLKAGIIDPYKVIKNSIIYSTNAAKSFMSIDSVILYDLPNGSYRSLDEGLNEETIY